MRKLRNLLIAVIAISVLTAVIPVSAAVTVSGDYVNLQFATSESYKTNSADSSTALTFNNFSGSASYSFEEILNSGTAKFTMPANVATTDRTRYIGQNAFMSTKVTGLDIKVTWYELSFKFEKYVSGISLRVDSPIFYINDNGDIYLDPNNDGYSGGTKVTNATCVTDKWYHLVIAYDYPDKNSNGRPKIYAYLNGELLTASSATDYSLYGSSRTCITELGRIQLAAHTSSQGAAVKYIDNFKIYTTANSVATDLASGAFDPMDIYDGTEITSDSLTIVDDKIYVDAEATLQDVADAVTVTTSSVYYDGTTAVADADMATTTAVGKTVYVRSTGGIGVKAYTIEEMPAYMLAEEYFNMNFDGDTGKENIAADALSITSWQTTNSSIQNDTIRSSNIKNVTRSSSSDLNWGKLSNTILIGTSDKLGIDIGKRTAWFELSFKLADLDGGIGIFDQRAIFTVSPGGTIRLGGLENWSGGGIGQAVTNAKIEAGKWYHMVVAVDHLDKGTLGNTDDTEYAKIYAWLNGKLLLTNSAVDNCSMVWANAVVGNKDEIDRVRVQYYFPKYENETPITSTGYIDNFKIYTTYTPVIDSDGNYSIDPLADYAKVSSDTLTIVDDEIYAAENASFADIYNALTLTDAGAVVNASGTDSSASTDAAKDSTIYVRSANGIGINTYTVKAAPEYGIITDTAAWTVADGKATLTTYFSNRGAEKGCVLILASYDSEGLVNVCTTDIAGVPAAGKEIVSNPIEVESDDLTIRAFIWSSKSGLVPLTTVCDSLPAYAG